MRAHWLILVVLLAASTGCGRTRQAAPSGDINHVVIEGGGPQQRASLGMFAARAKASAAFAFLDANNETTSDAGEVASIVCAVHAVGSRIVDELWRCDLAVGAFADSVGPKLRPQFYVTRVRRTRTAAPSAEALPLRRSAHEPDTAIRAADVRSQIEENVRAARGVTLVHLRVFRIKGLAVELTVKLKDPAGLQQKRSRYLAVLHRAVIDAERPLIDGMAITFEDEHRAVIGRSVYAVRLASGYGASS